MIEHYEKPKSVKELLGGNHNGLFQLMSDDSSIYPCNASTLDRLFITEYGMRRCGPLIYFWWEDDDFETEEDGTLLQTTRSHIATDVFQILKDKWSRQLDVFSSQYDPLHNFLDEYYETGSGSLTETENNGKSRTVDDDLTHGMTTTRTDNLSETGSSSSTSSGSHGADNDRYGLNSATAVGESKLTESDSDTTTGSHTTSNTGTMAFVDSGVDQRDITESERENKSKSNTTGKSLNGYHRGNIGNISTQKLIKEEYELWRWNLAKEMVKDVADTLTLPLYF